ncbi:MAG TPA: hypothetical protein VMT15_15665 [Bryobacteraceae bacterium]|nr:hypothetical protein [Bryobacteraceae bacterium]
MNNVCKKCEKRRARRHCPGIGADICPQCCGTERENTIDCPLDCEFLREARMHERPLPLSGRDIPNLDIQMKEDFLREHEREVMTLSLVLARAIDREKAVDLDAREALDSLVRTYRTLQSGLIYETRPQNPYAAAIQDRLMKGVEDLRKEMAEEAGMQVLRDTDVLATLVFLQRLEIQHNNGRRRGRAFLDFLKTYFPEPQRVEA